MKNLLLISYFFPPHGGAGVLRPLETVRLLEPLGWRSLVVAGPASGYWFSDPDLLDRVPPGAEISRTRAWTGPRLVSAARGLAGRSVGGRDEGAISRLRRLTDWLPLPDVYCGWAPSAIHAAMEFSRRASCILSTSPPETAHLVAGYVARRTGLPWVADFRDPWLRGIYRRYPTRFQRSWQAGMEVRTVGGADLVLANTEEACADFRARYPHLPADKFQCLPNGFDPAEFKTPEHPQRDPGVLRLIHAGGLTLERDPSVIMGALAGLDAQRGPDKPRIVLELAGSVDPRFLEQARKMAPGVELEVSGWLNRRDTLARLAVADGAVLLETFRPGAELVAPMKLYDYMGAGLPVFAVVPSGAASRVVAGAGCGVAVTENSPEEIAAALERFIQRLESGIGAYRPDPAAVSEFERPRLIQKLAERLDRVLS